MIEPGTASRPLVLIIEDDPWIRGISSELLEDEGFAIASAADGQAGLAIAERLRPAAILLDLGLPGMSGSEFLRCLRGRASLRATPVIVVSGQPEAWSQEASALADGFLRKPVDLTRLMQILQTAVARHDGAAMGITRAQSVTRGWHLGRPHTSGHVASVASGASAHRFGTRTE